MILLTATPHSGKPEEFHSLLGLLQPEFETLDLPSSSQNQRRDLARHFIQRKRGDVEKWMGEDTPFPTRDAFEADYSLSLGYRNFFEEILDFAKQMISVDQEKIGQRKVLYWTALALLRGVMSSPRAGVEMLNTRLSKLAKSPDDETAWSIESHDENPVRDTEFGFEGDYTPSQLMEQNDWSASQRQKLCAFSQQLEGLSTIKDDKKLASAESLLQEWLVSGFNPVIFCRYIATANYVGELLAPALKKKFPKLDIQVITSELPDELRKQKIEEMGKSKLRVLVATDCLSEGINLQDQFTAVLHYDLPWNPNRLEQREGRVDRFGQVAPEVKACLLYGADNPIDGIVLDVLLRKVREIKRSTGINVPFPEDSQSIIDTITQALLINPDRKITQRRDRNQLAFDFGEFNEAEEAKINVTRKVEEAAKREEASRSIFAQHAIKAHEIEADLKAVDEAIGDPHAVKDFVTTALNNLFGVQVMSEAKGYRIVTANMPDQLRGILPAGDMVSISFSSPTPEGYHYMGRNHRFVEQLCQLVMANTVNRMDKRAARTAVIRTKQVSIKTTLLLFRCRNVIEDRKGHQQVVAEEMILWGWKGTPQQKEYLNHDQARDLLSSARASSDLATPARMSFLDNELKLLQSFTTEFDGVAEQQSQKLVEAHERFSSLMDGKRFQVVHPVLPMDLLGVYVLLPE